MKILALTFLVAILSSLSQAYISQEQIRTEDTIQVSRLHGGSICQGVETIQRFSNSFDSFARAPKIHTVVESVIQNYRSFINARISNLTHYDHFEDLVETNSRFQTFSGCLYEKENFSQEQVSPSCRLTGPQLVGDENLDNRLREIKSLRKSLIDYQNSLRIGESSELSVSSIPRSCRSLRHQYLDLMAEYPSYFYAIQNYVRKPSESFRVLKNSDTASFFSTQTYEFVYSASYFTYRVDEPPRYNVPEYDEARFITLSYQDDIRDDLLSVGQDSREQRVDIFPEIGIAEADVVAETNLCDEALAVEFQIRFARPINIQCNFSLEEVVDALNSRCELQEGEIEATDNWYAGNFCEQYLSSAASDALYHYIINSFYRLKDRPGI